jgi:hypothetical protein
VHCDGAAKCTCAGAGCVLDCGTSATAMMCNGLATCAKNSACP